MPRFFGRDAELADLDARFGAGHRLVTLVGPPGMGKTRLAREWALRSTLEFTFVDLSESRTAAALKDALADAFDDEDEDAPSLLLLDNFEGVVEHAALLTELHRRSSDVKLLVTSRERLRLSDETVLELAPLEPAVEMFVDRVHHRRGSYEPSRAELARIRHIVESLDRIPLAIELAAHRAALLGIASVEAWLNRPLDLASTGPRDAPDRHRTMRHALGQSWLTLSEDERTILSACAVFRGGFSPADLARVVMVEAALDVLHQLREKSLVTPHGSDRFRLLMIVREYVIERCDPHDYRELEERHASHFCALASRPQADELDWLVREWDNLMAAFERLTERGPPDLEGASRILLVAGETGFRAGHVSSLIERIDSVLADETALAPSRRSELWLLRSNGELRRRRRREADADFDRALVLAHEIEDASLIARLLRVKSMRLARAGLLSEARALFERAGALHDPSVSGRQDAFDVMGIASAMRQAMQFESARALLVQYLESATDPTDRAQVLVELGLAELEMMHNESAIEHLNAARAVFEEAGWLADQARAELVLALIWLSTDEIDSAERLLTDVIESAERIGQLDTAGYAWGYLGVIFMHLGRDEPAAHAFAQARTRVPDQGHDALFAAYAAAVAARRGQIEHARRSWLQSRSVEVPPCLRAAISLQSVHIDLAEADRAVRTGRGREAVSAYERAINTVRRARGESGEEMWALKVAQAALVRYAANHPDDVPEELAVHPDGQWFQRGSNDPVLCGRHANVRRALMILTEAHASQPGRTLDWSELVRSIWPNESISEAAAKNRLRVTMAHLRRLGLTDLLVTEAPGYRLSQRVKLKIVDAGRAAS